MNDKKDFLIPDESDIDAILRQVKSFDSPSAQTPYAPKSFSNDVKADIDSFFEKELNLSEETPDQIADSGPEEAFSPEGTEKAPEKEDAEDIEAAEENLSAPKKSDYFPYSVLDETAEREAIGAEPEADSLLYREAATKAFDTGDLTPGQKIRRDFFSDIKIENTAEQDTVSQADPIERPGLLMEKGLPSKTSDLEAVPTVLLAEEVLKAAKLEQEKTRVDQDTPQSPPKVPEKDRDILDGQIVFRGFDAPEADEVRVGTRTVEEELYKKRKEMAKEFVSSIDGQGEISGLSNHKTSSSQDRQDSHVQKKNLEYRFAEQRNRIDSFLFSARKKNLAKVFALSVIEVLSLIFTFLPRLLDSAAVDSAAFGHGGKALIFSQLILLCLAAFFSLSDISSGLKSLFKRKPNCDFGLTLTVAVTAIHLVLSALLTQPENLPTFAFTPVAVFLLLSNSLAHLARGIYTHGNFKFCAFDEKDKLHGISSVDGSDAALELSRGLLVSNPGVLYSAPTDFPTDFIKNSSDRAESEKNCSIITYVTLAIAAVFGLICGLVGKSPLFGFSCFTAAVAVGTPPAALLVYSLPLLFANKKLNPLGAMITNTEAALDLAEKNAFVVDSTQLYDLQGSALHGFKEYGRIRLDDVVLYATAMILESEGPLCPAFEAVIGGKRDLLPRVTSFAYEDKQGLSGLIHNQTVLMGNRTLMINHSVDGIPDKSAEDKYKQKGRRVLYLAVANKVVAIFVVSYKADQSLSDDLKKLMKNDFRFLVRTRDVNVSEEALADQLNHPINNIKVVGTNASRLLRRLSRQKNDSFPAKAIHNGSLPSFLKSIVKALEIKKAIKIGAFLQVLAVALGLLTLIIFVSLSSSDRFGPAQIVLFQAFWAALTALVAALVNL